ncbi:MAG: hypothetical protein ACRD2L_12940, partial [Terriglobia bacterium]
SKLRARCFLPDTAEIQTARRGLVAERLIALLYGLALIASPCLVPSLSDAQESPGAEGEQPEFNSGLDPTNLPPTYGFILSQGKFASGDRLRTVSLRAIHKFDRDYAAMTIPFGDFAPGTPSSTYATGLGDIRLEYLHVFPNLSDRVVHGLGASLQLDTATQSELGSGTTVVEPFYVLSYYKEKTIQLVLITRYLRDIGAGFGTPISDTVLLSPFVIFERPGNWYAQVKFNNFIDLKSEPNTFTSEVGIGNVIGGHYNVGFFYEFPLNHDSRLFNVQARFTLNLLYQF